jgi:hypothetical protein
VLAVGAAREAAKVLVVRGARAGPAGAPVTVQSVRRVAEGATAAPRDPVGVVEAAALAAAEEPEAPGSVVPSSSRVEA